jgi:hypothetical protein
VTAWLPRPVGRRVAVARRRRSRMRGRTRPRTVGRRRWGRWTGPPDADPRAADQQHERGRSAGPVDDPRVGCVASFAGSSCHPSLSVEVPPLVCCPSRASAQHPMSHRRSRDCRSASADACTDSGSSVGTATSRRETPLSCSNVEGGLLGTAHSKACCVGVSTPVAPPCRGPLRFGGHAESGPAVKESRLASDHLFFSSSTMLATVRSDRESNHSSRSDGVGAQDPQRRRTVRPGHSQARSLGG